MFSSWLTAIDIIAQGLRNDSIGFLRYDGTVPQKERQSVLDRFRRDPSIRVLLLTLSCGAVGFVHHAHYLIFYLTILY